MKVPGIILIEVLIGTAIASFVGTILIGAWYQTNRFSRAVDESIVLYTRASLLEHQLERDLSGAFAPEVDMQQTGTGAQQSDRVPGKAKEEKKQKPLEKIFYGENQENQLKLLTFITNNPLQVYWSGTAGKPKARIARVVYRVEQEKEEKKSYILYRQEEQELDFKEYKHDAEKPIRRYELVRGIKNITVEYTVIEEQEEPKDKEKEKAKEPPKREYKEFKEWKEPDEKEKEKEKKRPLIPDQVKVQVTFWDTLGKRETPFTFMYPILVRPKEQKQQNSKGEPQKGSSAQQQEKTTAQGKSQRSTLTSSSYS